MFTDGQRAAIHEARNDYYWARRQGRYVDVVDIATETDNYWWQRLDDRSARVAGRYITFGIPSLKEAR